jgi:hypothetical protein
MLEAVVNNSDRSRVALFDEAPHPMARVDRAAPEHFACWVVVRDKYRTAKEDPAWNRSPLWKLFHAGHHRRTKQLERTLRVILASDFITDEQRSEVASVLFGKTKIARDGRKLSETEWDLVGGLSRVGHGRKADAAHDGDAGCRERRASRNQGAAS